MKILIITDAWLPQVNGVVRTYEYISAELTRCGHTVKVIGPSDFPQTYPMPGYDEIRLVLFPYPRLKQMIEHFQPDAIHIGTEGPLGWAARKYCLRHNIRFTTCYHTQFPDYVAKRVAKFIPFLHAPTHMFCLSMLKRFHNTSAALMVATPRLEAELKAEGFTARMVRLTRGVRQDIFYPGGKREFLDLPKPVALYVGRIAIEKNLEDFLAMPWHGSKVLVGDGPSLHDLKQKYPNAYFVGKKTGTDLASHYRSADVFVFPSRTDTFGMVVIEALASGLPVAAYNVTGPGDIIDSPELGALCDTPDQLTQAANTAIQTGNALQRAAHVTEHYTWEKAAAQFLDAVQLAR